MELHFKHGVKNASVQIKLSLMVCESVFPILSVVPPEYEICWKETQDGAILFDLNPKGKHMPNPNGNKIHQAHETWTVMNIQN